MILLGINQVVELVVEDIRLGRLNHIALH